MDKTAENTTTNNQVSSKYGETRIYFAQNYHSRLESLPYLHILMSSMKYTGVIKFRQRKHIGFCSCSRLHSFGSKYHSYVAVIVLKLISDKIGLNSLLLLRNGLNRAYCSVSARLKCQF